MRIVSRNLKFLASTSPDVVDNRLYYTVSPNVVTDTSPFVLMGNDVDVDGYVDVDIATLLPNDIDGIFNLGVAPIDDIGNEGPMTVANDVPLDFVAPDAVGPLEIY